MRVLLLIDGLEGGGAETSTLALVPGLAERCSVLMVATLHPQRPEVIQEIENAGAGFVPVTGRSLFTQALNLRRVLRANRIDIVHSALWQSDQIARLAAIGVPTRTVSSLVTVPRTPEFRGSAADTRPRARAANALDWVTAKLMVDRFHAVTQGVADSWASYYGIDGRCITVVERGRAAERFRFRTDESRSATRRALGLPATGSLVLGVGRQQSLKAFEDAVAATALLRRDGHAASLLLAGRPSSGTPKILHEIQAGEAAEFVKLLGQRDDVPDLITASDVLLVSSRLEGTAGVALEAMAIGAPIVATDLPGTRGVLRHEENCLLVDVGDRAAMASAIQRLLTDATLAQSLAVRARQDFEERFSLERAAAETVKLYETCFLGGRGPKYANRS